MKLSDRLNRLVHPLMAKRVCAKYNRKMDAIAKRRPDLFKPVDAATTKRHLDLWGRLGLPCNDKWLRMLSNLSGIVDYRYLPEDLFFARVERILADCNRSGAEAEDKNEYSLFIDKKYQPRFVLRFMRGEFFDEDYGWLSDETVDRLLSVDQGDVIGKKSIASFGGHGVCGYSFRKNGYYDDEGHQLTAAYIRRNYLGYVVQERVIQCDFSAQFNPSSANTCRIITLRCPWDGKTVVTKAGMRFGASKEVFDNLSSGGVCVSLGPNGELGQYGRNWYKLDQWETHPTSGVRFAGQVHPYYPKMAEVACALAAKMPNFNLVSWDFIADKNGDVKILEANESSQGCDWEQYDFGPFFGDLTEKVVDWCVAHPELDKFNHMRTWY